MCVWNNRPSYYTILHYILYSYVPFVYTMVHYDILFVRMCLWCLPWWPTSSLHPAHQIYTVTNRMSTTEWRHQKYSHLWCQEAWWLSCEKPVSMHLIYLISWELTYLYMKAVLFLYDNLIHTIVFSCQLIWLLFKIVTYTNFTFVVYTLHIPHAHTTLKTYL